MRGCRRDPTPDGQERPRSGDPGIAAIARHRDTRGLTADERGATRVKSRNLASTPGMKRVSLLES
jgi:hypothetical protein